MQISWQCLNQLIDLTNISPLDIANKLTLAGFEVENVTHQNDINDIILDINITANRPDIIGTINIAVELSSLLERSLKLDLYTKTHIVTKTLTNAYNLNLFQELYLCTLKNIDTKYNNKYINNQLLNSNIKVTNTIFDIINFINLKWGQEIHIYKLSNYDNINHSWFNFNLNQQNKLVNNLDIYINNNILIPISYQNINEHKNISNLLLINYKYKNEYYNITNKKFTYPQYCIYAFQDILNRISIKPTNTLTIYQYCYKNNSNHIIICTIEKINKILGPIINSPTTFINRTKIINILQNLNFNTYEKDNILYIQIPPERIEDIKSEIDIIEEIGRIYGFNYFKDNLPRFTYINQISKITSITQKIRRILRSMGLHEVINYSLQSKKTQVYIPIINPLNKEQTTLRNNLIHNLILSKTHNTYQANYTFEAFEIGTVFLKHLQQHNYSECLHVCCILGNQKFNQITWENNSSALNWFQAKGHLEELFEKINAKISWALQTNNDKIIQHLREYIHPKRKIYINNQDKTIGILSELNNKISKTINISYKIYFFEINIYELEKTIKHQPNRKYTYIPYSQYPKITRDFSFQIHTKFSMENINHIFFNIPKQFKNIIESITILNEYYNNKNTKTLCLRVTYRSQQRTLTNKEIQILDNMLKTKFDTYFQSKT